MRRQIVTIQYLRGFASVAVVLYHIYLWELKALGSEGIVPSFLTIGESGVDMFFVISGFIMVFIQPSPIASGGAYFGFLLHRFSRVYPPVWIVMILLVPVWMWRPYLFNSFHGHRVDLLRSFLLVPQDYFPLLGVAWTLIHEVYFYFVVSLALCLQELGRWVFGCTWFALVLVVFCFFGQTRFDDNRTLELVFSPFSLTFLLGYFIGLLYRRISRWNGSMVMGVLAAGAIALIAGYLWIPPVGVYPDNNHLSRFVAYGIPSCIVLVAALGFDSRLSHRISAFTVLGDASYAIYLVHLPIVAGFYFVVKRFTPVDEYGAGALAFACLLASVFGGIAFHKFVERHVIRASRRLVEKALPAAST